MSLLIRTVLLALYLSIFSVSATATELWQGAQSGQSAEEILLAFENARPNPSPDTLNTGASCDLKIDQLQVARYSFAVCFFLLDGKLDQVTLSLDSDVVGKGGHAVFDRVLEALRSKYGEENDLEKKEGSFLTTSDANWYLGDLNINLLMLFVGDDGDVSVNINYQTRVSQGAANL